MHRNREIVRMSKGSFCPLQQKERASKKKIVSLWGIVGGCFRFVNSNDFCWICVALCDVAIIKCNGTMGRAAL